MVSRGRSSRELFLSGKGRGRCSTSPYHTSKESSVTPIGSKAGRTRGAPKNIRALDIANLMTKAGWEWRRGHGDHIVISKQGQRNIILAEPLSMATWKEVERTVGVEIEALTTKMTKRGRGVHLPAEELRKRFDLALGLHRAGFQPSYVLKWSRLQQFRDVDRNFSPATIEALGVEEAMRKYALKEVAPVTTRAATPKELRSLTPTELREFIDTHPPEDMPVAGAREEVAAPVLVAERDDVYVSLLQEMQHDVHELVVGRAERAAAYAERLRLTYRRLADVHTELGELLKELADFGR